MIFILFSFGIYLPYIGTAELAVHTCPGLHRTSMPKLVLDECFNCNSRIFLPIIIPYFFNEFLGQGDLKNTVFPNLSKFTQIIIKGWKKKTARKLTFSLCVIVVIPPQGYSEFKHFFLSPFGQITALETRQKITCCCVICQPQKLKLLPCVARVRP